MSKSDPKNKRRRYLTLPFGPEFSEEERKRLEEAFGYLQKMDPGKYNFTSATPFPILPESVKVVRDHLSDPKASGYSRGERDFLENCKSFFESSGIRCSEEDISSTQGILSSIDSIYDHLLGDKAEKRFKFDIDEHSVIVPYPTFGFYFTQLKEKKMDFSTFETFSKDEFLPDPDRLEKHILSMKKKPKILLLCYPNNPTGAKMTKDVAERLVAIAKKHDIMIISDEVYILNSLYSETLHYPIARVEGAFECSVSLFDPSKSSGITGIESGVILGNKSIVDDFEKLGGYSKVNQQVVSAVIDLKDDRNIDYFDRMREKYKTNIELISQALLPKLNQAIKDILGAKDEYPISIKPVITYPEYSNVYLIDFSCLKDLPLNEKILKTGLDVVRFLYKEAGVAFVPGECSLFKSEDMIVRVALGHEPEVFREAFQFIQAAFAKVLSPDYEHVPDSSDSEHEDGVDVRGRTFSSVKMEKLVEEPRVNPIEFIGRAFRDLGTTSSSDQEVERSSPLSFENFDEEGDVTLIFEGQGGFVESPTPGRFVRPPASVRLTPSQDVAASPALAARSRPSPLATEGSRSPSPRHAQRLSIDKELSGETEI